MQNVKDQKVKLEQKKNRLLLEEQKLKFKERKMRTCHLIEIGGLVTKADLDYLPTNTLFGALLSLKQHLKSDPTIEAKWTKSGKSHLDQEEQSKFAVIVKFEQEPSAEIRKIIREHGLKWNRLRAEWYGYIANVESLHKVIDNTKHTIEYIK